MARPKTRTSINLSKQVLVDIRASGIRNISKYFEDLAKADLYSVSKMSSQEQELLTKLDKRLAALSDEWEALQRREAQEEKRQKVTQ